MTFALPDKRVSEAISRDWSAVALQFESEEVQIPGHYDHSPSANGDFHWTTRGHEEEIDPPSSSVDETAKVG